MEFKNNQDITAYIQYLRDTCGEASKWYKDLAFYSHINCTTCSEYYEMLFDFIEQLLADEEMAQHHETLAKLRSSLQDFLDSSMGQIQDGKLIDICIPPKSRVSDPGRKGNDEENERKNSGTIPGNAVRVAVSRNDGDCFFDVQNEAAYVIPTKDGAGRALVLPYYVPAFAGALAITLLFAVGKFPLWAWVYFDLVLMAVLFYAAGKNWRGQRAKARCGEEIKISSTSSEDLAKLLSCLREGEIMRNRMTAFAGSLLLLAVIWGVGGLLYLMDMRLYLPLLLLLIEFGGYGLASLHCFSYRRLVKTIRKRQQQ